MSDKEDFIEVAEGIGVRISSMPGGGEKLDIDALLQSGAWALQDVTWVPETVFDAIAMAAGEGHVHVLAMSTRRGWRRGQILISDQGRKNIGDARDDLLAVYDASKAGNGHPAPDQMM